MKQVFIVRYQQNNILSMKLKQQQNHCVKFSEKSDCIILLFLSIIFYFNENICDEQIFHTQLLYVDILEITKKLEKI